MTYFKAVSLQFFSDTSSQIVLGKHAHNGLPQHLLRPRLQVGLHVLLLQSAWIACVPRVLLVHDFGSGELDLFRVDDNNIVPAIEVLGEGRLMLAAKNVSDLCGESVLLTRDPSTVISLTSLRSVRVRQRGATAAG